MRYYNEGIRNRVGHPPRMRQPVRLPGRSSAVVGADPLIWTGTDTAALMRRVDARYKALQRAVVAAEVAQPGALSLEWRTSWGSAFDAWNHWRQSICVQRGSDPCASFVSMLDSVGWGGTASEAQSYDRELDTWRAQYQAATGRAAAGTSSSSGDAPASEWSGTIRFVAGAAIVVAIVYGASRVL